MPLGKMPKQRSSLANHSVGVASPSDFPEQNLVPNHQLLNSFFLLVIEEYIVDISIDR
jgi:hypothetical protein